MTLWGSLVSVRDLIETLFIFVGRCSIQLAVGHLRAMRMHQLLLLDKLELKRFELLVEHVVFSDEVIYFLTLGLLCL